MLFNPDECEPLHHRHIKVTTYAFGEDAIALEGRLVDDRTNVSHNLFGERRPPGTIHDLIVRMIVRLPGMVIEAIETEMVTVPVEACPEAIESLSPLQGERITAGFTAKVQRLVGGRRGCAHLLALTRAMASAAIQGAYASISRRAPVERRFGMRHLKPIINTCHVWRSDGPLIARLKAHLTDGDTPVAEK